jgi:hypothetical protein
VLVRFVGAVSYMCTSVVCQIVHVYQCHVSSSVCYIYIPGPVTRCQGFCRIYFCIKILVPSDVLLTDLIVDRPYVCLILLILV